MLAAAVALVGVLTERYPRIALDRLVLAALLAVPVASLTGLPGLGTLGDPLHILYAGVALVALPAARYLARSGAPRRRATWMLLGALVMCGVVARLFLTGGA